jgi:hypothetical protein
VIAPNFGWQKTTSGSCSWTTSATSPSEILWPTGREASEKRPEWFFFFTRVFYCNNFFLDCSRVNIKLECLLGIAGTKLSNPGWRCFVDRDLKVAKKPYIAPSFRILDAGSAKAELEANGALDDANARQMLSVLNQPPDGKPAPAPSTVGSSLP